MTLYEARNAIARYETFNAGNLTGAWEDYGKGTKGYVVRSYGVLIAESYNRYAGLSTDAYDYSVTTSKHANIIKTAWGLL